MIRPGRIFAVVMWVVLLMATPFREAAPAQQPCTRDDHVAWVIEALKRMQTIKPGMTREAVLGVFTTEGGLSTPMHRTFVSRDCPYFKVDVEFRRATGRAQRDMRHDEDPTDIILTISKPYLEFGIFD